MYDVEVRRDSAKVRQKKVMEYLWKHGNPDVIKEDIVKALKENKDGSRHTIYKAIDELEDLDKIIVNRENRQLHWVSINPRSQLNKINELKEAFFVLIDEAVLIFRELSIKSKEGIANDEAMALAHASSSLTMLFEHMLGIYMLYFMFEWPKMFPNTMTREKLYEEAFQAVKDIQFRLEEAFGIGGQMVVERGFIVSDFFTMNSNKLYSTITNLEHVGLSESAEALLDILWKLGRPFIPDALFEMYGRAEDWKKRHRKKIEKVLNKVEDWRNVVKEYDDSLSSYERRWASVPR